VSKSHRHRDPLPAGLIHAVVRDLGYALRCGEPLPPYRRSWHGSPDHCIAGHLDYRQPLAEAVNAPVFAAALVARGWRGHEAWSYVRYVEQGFRYRHDFASDRRASWRALRRYNRAMARQGREEDIRPFRPARGWDRW
jgi:hypothetical protein